VLTYATIDEEALTVSGNVIGEMKGPGIVGSQLVGGATLTHNQVAGCGYEPVGSGNGFPMPKISAGIFVFNSQGHLRIESCEVTDTGVGKGELPSSSVGIRAATHSCQIANNRVAYSDAELVDKMAGQEHRALVLSALVPAGAKEGRTGHAVVTGNSLAGAGFTHLVEIGRPAQIGGPAQDGFERVTFSNNYCDHATSAPAKSGAAATIAFNGQHLIVMGNHVQAPDNILAMSFDTPSKLVLIGNVTTGTVTGQPVGTNVVPDLNAAVDIAKFNVILP
jgi:hypothetical protein